VVAGFSAHPHWDHLLWHPRFGDVPRYATPAGARLAADYAYIDALRRGEVPVDARLVKTGSPAPTRRTWSRPEGGRAF
jgi:hypothetical protein